VVCKVRITIDSCSGPLLGIGNSSSFSFLFVKILHHPALAMQSKRGGISVSFSCFCNLECSDLDWTDELARMFTIKRMHTSVRLPRDGTCTWNSTYINVKHFLY
jgi:hypothetical protein